MTKSLIYRFAAIVSLIFAFGFAQATGSHESASGWSLADKLALGALIMALIALPFAVKQYVDAKHQTEKLEAATSQLAEQTKRLGEIWSSLSTHYLGVFPDYLPEIVETLEGAKKSIVIFCDYPAYARFSNPTYWLEYKQIIERKVQAGVEVSLTCLNAEQRRQYHNDQFSKARADWEAFKSNAKIQHNLEQLFQYHKESLDNTCAAIADLSFEDFEKLMSAANQSMIEDVFAKMKTPLVELSSDMPLYFWLADGLRAVFAIPSLSDDATEYGFVTGEARLITAFQNMRDRYLRRELKRKSESKTSITV